MVTRNYEARRGGLNKKLKISLLLIIMLVMTVVMSSGVLGEDKIKKCSETSQISLKQDEKCTCSGQTIKGASNNGKYCCPNDQDKYKIRDSSECVLPCTTRCDEIAKSKVGSQCKCGSICKNDIVKVGQDTCGGFDTQKVLNLCATRGGDCVSEGSAKKRLESKRKIIMEASTAEEREIFSNFESRVNVFKIYTCEKKDLVCFPSNSLFTKPPRKKTTTKCASKQGCCCPIGQQTAKSKEISKAKPDIVKNCKEGKEYWMAYNNFCSGQYGDVTNQGECNANEKDGFCPPQCFLFDKDCWSDKNLGNAIWDITECGGHLCKWVSHKTGLGKFRANYDREWVARINTITSYFSIDTWTESFCNMNSDSYRLKNIFKDTRKGNFIGDGNTAGWFGAKKDVYGEFGEDNTGKYVYSLQWFFSDLPENVTMTLSLVKDNDIYEFEDKINLIQNTVTKAADSSITVIHDKSYDKACLEFNQSIAYREDTLAINPKATKNVKKICRPISD